MLSLNKKLIAALAAAPVLTLAVIGSASAGTNDYETICDKNPQACGSDADLTRPHKPTLPPVATPPTTPTKPKGRYTKNHYVTPAQHLDALFRSMAR